MTSTMPRAFLSHSSADKPYVTQVFDELGHTLAELDQATFEPAKLSYTAILKALDRCSCFVLFASSKSMESNWVAKEIKEAIERTKTQKIKKIVVYCVDKSIFAILNPELKEYNVVRIEQSPAVCARQIRGILAEIRASETRSDLFISRDENVAELKRLVIDPEKNYRTLAVSGFERLGRRSLVQRFCRDIYGSFTPPKKSIAVDITSSLDDVFRQLIGLQFESLDRTELLNRITDFSNLDRVRQYQAIEQEIKSIHNQREFVQFIDQGGLIADDGDLSDMMKNILARNKDASDLIHILVTYRTPPQRIQRNYPDIAFYRLPPLTDAQAEISILHELKKRKSTLPKETINKLVSTCDGHPANLDYVIGYIFDGPTLNKLRLEEVLSGSKDFTNYKRERAAAYVKKFPFTRVEQIIIASLANYRALPAELLAEIAKLRDGDPAATGTALGRLYELNIIDTDGSTYRLIRPLRDALERDSQFDLKKTESDEIARLLADSIESYGATDTFPVSLMEGGALASIRQKKNATGWARQLVLPSHYIWLARDSYHSRLYQDSLEYARKALELANSMTDDAKLEALRFNGLSCARLGLDDELSKVVQSISRIKSKRAAGNANFLLGFAARLRGELNTALAELTLAATKLTGSLDVQRELISVYLAKGLFENALSLSEDLVQRSEDNPYALDGYLQAKIATALNVALLDHDAEFCRRLAKLKDVGDGPGRAFYSLRMAELCLKRGDKGGALSHALRAVANAPNLPAARAMHARALIADGQLESAWDAVRAIEELGTKKTRLKDGLENITLFKVRFEFNLSKREYELCRRDVSNMERFDVDQARSMKRDLSFAVAKSGAKLDPNLTKWLKS